MESENIDLHTHTRELLASRVSQHSGWELLLGKGKEAHQLFFLCYLAEQRQLALAEKFKELKRSKKLDSFLSRKRRRNAGKDRRHLPLNKD